MLSIRKHYLILVLIFLFFQCKKTEKPILIGAWKLADVQLISSAQHNSLPENMNHLKENFVIAYFEDSSYFVMIDNDVKKGKWQFDKNKNELTETNHLNQKMNFYVTNLSKDTIAMTTADKNLSFRFVLTAIGSLPKDSLQKLITDVAK